MEAPDGTKQCPDCGEVKAVSEFGLNKRMPGGRARYCKACFRVRSTASYRKRMAEQGKTVRERLPVPEGQKFCARCAEIKPKEEFGSNRASKDGLTIYCLPCHVVVTRENKIKKYGSERNYLLTYRYGITEDDFERMLARQGGLCAICRVVPGVFVDHCHATGLVRGVLCFNCNNGLGHFGDNTVLLELAALYLDGEVLWPEFVVLPERREAGPVAPTRSYHLSQRYRVRHEDVERMVAAQHGLCVVCWDRPPEHVDHCHRSGDVRYALCLPCNTGIGQFRDDAGVVWRALSYIEATVEEYDDVVVPEEELRELIEAEERLRGEFYSRVSRVG
ncbi:endonuclease domain-containing protein [Nonomuraea jiangxiensis]|uniref:Recombination endonuclease VII n=1 Tax=Nonomuraea jiangxiensis TaxID=633440 RepID=A0A1G9DPJ5_9ACTN|nr:endonuclease domain-containing protein [Nonomuraea jiangxiensis]SDK65804.1 Recombination endonuclease VII [Nonomuraea jiangxiensis]